MPADARQALLAWCDETERVARAASPEPWDADGWVYGDARTESYGVWAGEPDAAHPRDPIAKTTRFEQGWHNAKIMAASPSLARSLAAVLRAVADNAGTTDLSHPVLADVLAACEPLLALTPPPEGTS